MIRTSNTFFSYTITDVDCNGDVTSEQVPFRLALHKRAYFVVYEYHGEHYYPLTLEFRLIDNNVLYLIEELGCTDIDEVFRIISSSMEKEEKSTHEYKLAVVHLNNEPRYMHKLPPILYTEAKHIYEP